MVYWANNPTIATCDRIARQYAAKSVEGLMPNGIWPRIRILARAVPEVLLSTTSDARRGA